MSRKLLFILACTCLFSADAFSQRREVSLNTTNVISNIFSLSDQADLRDPHSIAIRFFKEKEDGTNRILRIKAGINVLGSISSSNTIGFSSRTLDDWLIISRIGFEKQKFLSKKFEFYYGWEFGFSYRRTQSVIGFDFETITNTNESFGLGTGPYTGFQFHFNDKISIYTESNLYFEYVRTEQELDDAGVGFDGSTEEAFKLNHFLPNSLYFAIAF